ncbi:tetratricopeptide repeat protein [bacterium]|nr:tetratricopeptide repeat protein [bacterium]
MQEALDFLKDAIIEEPQNAEVWVWVAAIIDDLDKQEIFLKKALEIDPRNIPAQRGLAYLRKRKQDQSAVVDDHLSDHTSPISPFPSSERQNRSQSTAAPQDLNLQGIDGIAEEPDSPAADTNPASKEGFFANLPKLTPIEITLLGVVVVVFCFIGLLAASALFEVDLPFGPLGQGLSASEMEPPTNGVFLYESENFIQVPLHKGLPSTDEGMPTSTVLTPTIIVWDETVDLERLSLIFETGVYVPFSTTNLHKNLVSIEPTDELLSGLYCFQQLPLESTMEAASYWCFKVNPAPAE